MLRYCSDHKKNVRIGKPCSTCPSKNELTNNLILGFAGLISGLDCCPLEVGKMLEECHADDLTNGGFWVWEIGTDIEYYSPNFRKVLGFEGEHDFPSVAGSWQNQINEKDKVIALANFTNSLNDQKNNPYYQEVEYTTKLGKKINLICSGVIVSVKGKNKYLIGTHKLI